MEVAQPPLQPPSCKLQPERNPRQNMPTKAARSAAVESALRLLTLRKPSWAEETLASEVLALRGELAALLRKQEAARRRSGRRSELERTARQTERRFAEELALRIAVAYWRGHTMQDVANVFGFSLTTVQKRLRWVRATFTALCDPACERCKKMPINITPCKACLSSLPLRRAR